VPSQVNELRLALAHVVTRFWPLTVAGTGLAPVVNAAELVMVSNWTVGLQIPCALANMPALVVVVTALY